MRDSCVITQSLLHERLGYQATNVLGSEDSKVDDRSCDRSRAAAAGRCGQSLAQERQDAGSTQASRLHLDLVSDTAVTTPVNRWYVLSSCLRHALIAASDVIMHSNIEVNPQPRLLCVKFVEYI